MRHQKKRHQLGRTAAHRKATLAALASALIEHKRIETTLPKAKALRAFVEPLITRSKQDTVHNRREAFRHLRNKRAVHELFNGIASEVGDRPGGYTRVVRLGQRRGDSAEMAVIELVDWNDVKPEGAAGTRKKTRRGAGRQRRKQTAGPPQAGAAGTDEAPAEAAAAKPPSAGTHSAPKTPRDSEASRRRDLPQGTNPGSGSPPPEAGKGTKGVAGGSKHRG